MEKFFKAVKRKISGLILALVVNGVILLLLGFLIVWTDFMLRLVMGLIAVVVAFMFFYGAYRVWSFKEDLSDYLKFLK